MFKNVKNPAFKRNAMILLVLGILMYYVFCVTVGEQISILATYLSAETGWNPQCNRAAHYIRRHPFHRIYLPVQYSVYEI